MKKWLLALLLLFAGTAFCRAADDRAAVLLERMSANFRSMKSYGVTFEITAGDYRSAGRYTVAGERYYLAMGDAEVFGDDKLRREIDNRRREVTIVSVDADGRNLLNNPVHAFEFVGDEYAATLLWERDGKAAIRLTPTVKNASASNTITVTLSTATMRPLSLAYNYESEHISIAVTSVMPLSAPIKTFDKADYSGYEFIDFR